MLITKKTGSERARPATQQEFFNAADAPAAPGDKYFLSIAVEESGKWSILMRPGLPGTPTTYKIEGISPEMARELATNLVTLQINRVTGS